MGAVHGGDGEGAFAAVEGEDPLLDGVLGDEAVDEHRGVLAVPMGPVGGLILDGRAVGDVRVARAAASRSAPHVRGPTRL